MPPTPGRPLRRWLWSQASTSRLLARLLVAGAALLAHPAGAATAPPAPPPNLVLIMADDLGYGALGCYGGTVARTPHLDQLAASGVRGTDFHSSGTVCSPTRAALLTGRYAQRCAWVPDEELSPIFQEQRRLNLPQRWAWGIATREVTLPARLRLAGYQTALIGKWHLGYDEAFHPMNFGFDEFRGFMGGNVDYHTHIAGYGRKQLDWWLGRKIENEAGYTTELLTTYAIDFLTRHQGRPFFLYLAHAAPHDPWQTRNPERKAPPAEIYREMIEGLDASVGAVTAALRRLGLERNTLLIFCSDNGAAAPRGVRANGQLQGKKGGMQEGGHRVPLIASWPGMIPAGTTTAATVITMDLFPTLARLAQATIPDGHRLDGTDILPLLQAPFLRPARTLHWLFGDDWAVRQGAWKLTGRGPDAVSLVNLDEDLEENRNERMAQPERTTQLAALHRQWLADVGPR